MRAPSTRIHASAAGAPNATPAIALAANVIDLLIHLIGGSHDFRIRFISPLAHDQVDELLDHADVGLLDVALHQTARAFLPAGIAESGFAGGVGGQIEVSANHV